MDFLDFIRKERKGRKHPLVQKGGKGSGWYAPPKGTHTEGAEAGAKGEAGGKRTITLSSKTTDAQFAELMGDALEPHSFGTAVPIEIKHAERKQTMSAHIIQHRLRGRVILSQEIKRHGKPYQSFSSFSLRGPNRGKLRWDSQDSHSLLVEQGWNPKSGFLTR